MHLSRSAMSPIDFHGLRIFDYTAGQSLGSSLATIGLTIPAVAEAAYLLDKTLVLGLPSRDIALLAMTMLVSMMTFGTGRTNILFGLVHLVIFAIFLLLVFVP